MSRDPRVKTARNSNIELLRIVSMILISLHHLCVHGPWAELAGGALPHAAMDALSLGGKVGVNCFVLITGYFLCRSTFKSRSFLKTLFETIFYSLAILAIFSVALPTSITGQTTIKSFIPASSGLYWFMTNYLALYLASPFINKLLNSLSAAAHARLAGIGLAVFCLIPTISTYNPLATNFVWFVYLYCVGAFVKKTWGDADSRRTRMRITLHTLSKKRNCALIMLCCVAFIVAHACIVDWAKFNVEGFKGDPRYFMAQNSLPIFAIPLSLFCFFARIEMKPNSVVNYIAGSTLGVYLIHDNPLVRKWLWPHFEWIFTRDIIVLIALSVFIAIAVFFTCIAIDIVRRRCIEKPFFSIIERVFGKQLDRVDVFMNRFDQSQES